MIKVKIYIITLILLLCGLTKISAQTIVMDTLVLEQEQIKPNELLVGVNYGYAITNAMFTPTIKTAPHMSPLNLAVLMTYYTPLWGYMDYFGFQTGLKYTNFGYKGIQEGFEYLYGDVTSIQLPITSIFKYDIKKRFRIMFNLGGFVGYRIDNNKGAFDCFDRRWDYGIEAGLGFAVKLHPVELHLGVGYQYNLSWFYHPEKLSSEIWIFSFPTALSINFGVHFKLK